jgi:GT2 family glycosyltransferase
VDDDNVLAPDYLEGSLSAFASHPRVGLAGGRSVPRFSSDPPGWAREFYGLLALRDLGGADRISQGLRPRGSERNAYPDFAPIGAGMALRRAAWQAWLDAPASGLSDRRGGALSSSGDNDIVLCAMRAGWEVGYFPGLVLTHLIPPGRLEASYLARLNRGIQKSWMQVLARHDASPWPPITPAGAALRKARAWFTHRAWSSPAARIRWNGACGHFEGRVP